MSSYVNFYLRVNDKFAPIGSYSRSSEMYQTVSRAVPYEKITALKSRDISSLIRRLEESAEDIQKTNEKGKSRISLIMNAENTPLNDKLAAVEEMELSCEAADEYISEITFAADTLRVFLNMIEDFKYSDSPFENDADHYIYAGVEACGNLESVEGE